MGLSIHTQAVLLLFLLVALAVLVLGQMTIKWARHTSSRRSEGGGTGREHAVWAATPLALGMAFASALLILVPFALASAPDSIPDSLLVPWVLAWGLIPCAVLGYLSGRWWSFVGAAPMVVLWPFGLVVGSTSEDVLTNADLFFALPAAAAMAVALSMGSAVRCWRTRGIQPPAVKADTPTPPVPEPPPNQPPFWPPPPGWKPTTPTRAVERKRASSRDNPPRREETRSPAQPSEARGFSVPSETPRRSERRLSPSHPPLAASPRQSVEDRPAELLDPADELAQAEALIAQGEPADGLDRLRRAREALLADPQHRNLEALPEVLRLAQAAQWRAKERDVRGQASDLVATVEADLRRIGGRVR